VAEVAESPETGVNPVEAEMAYFRSLTVLVSDVVGSTDLRVRLGPEGERLVRLHEDLARDAVASAGGKFVKGLGDGALAVFDAAADAIACAIGLQRRIEGLRHRPDGEQLTIRVGVSAGDVELSADDCRGLPVAESARICAAANPGEILVADVVRALARQSDLPIAAAGHVPIDDSGGGVPVWRVEWTSEAAGWAQLPLPARLATGAGSFVGRDEVVDIIFGLAASTLSGDPLHLHLVSGEAGVGKSALVAEVGRRLFEAGKAVVLYGACDEELRPPYQPFVHALRHLVRHAPTSMLESYARRYGGELALVIPELADRLGRMPMSRASADASDRYLLFDAVSGLLASVSQHVPVVVVLDDLHWADRGSLLLLRHLLFTPELSNVFILATFRDDEVHANQDLIDLLAEIHRLTGASRSMLEGLSYDELLELAHNVVGADDVNVAPIVGVVRKETGGNPFFAIELIRHLRETGLGFGTEMKDMPPSVREVIRRRVRRLGDDTFRMLTMAAVVGIEFAPAVVADISGMAPDAAASMLDEAARAGVVRESSTGTSYRFAHALTQHALYDELSAARRRRLHRLSAEALLRDSADPSPSAVALHWVRAEDMGDPMQAVAACTVAGDDALRQRAPEDAIIWFWQALLLLPEDEKHLHCELLLRLGEAQRLSGTAAHLETLLLAAQCAEEIGDPERLARAALARTRLFYSSVGRGDPEQLRLLESALEAIGDAPSVTRARLLATLSAEMHYTERSDERFAVIDEAIGIARSLGDAETIFDALFWRATGARHPLLTARDDEELAELTALARQLDPLRQAMADLVVVVRSLESGRLGAGNEALDRAVQLADDLRIPLVRWLITVLQATRATIAGDLDEAEVLAMQAFEISKSTDQPDATTWLGVQLYMIRYEQGRLGELLEMLASNLAEAPRLYTWHGGIAMAYAETGRLDEAKPMVDELLALDYHQRTGEPHWLIGMVNLSSAVARLGDRDAAAALYPALEPYAGQWASVMPMTLGAIDRILGQLAVVMGEWNAAERHFAEAVRIHDAAPAPSFAARARLGLITVLAARNGPGDMERIPVLADEVRAIARQHRLERVMEQLGIRLLDTHLT
jgi:class 3 adenylate cyclase/tetratricopeptide (TPR) repeat protein